MSAKPHARYLNPVLGETHWCPTRQAYVRKTDLRDPNRCRCGKAVKIDNRSTCTGTSRPA